MAEIPEEPTTVPTRLAEWENTVRSPLHPDRFSPREIAELPAPVRRHLTLAIRAGAPLSTAVRLRMRGRIKLGVWLPFSAEEVLDPTRGYLWTGRAGVLLRGSDRYLRGVASRDWRLAGIIPLIRSKGADASRSAIGRAMAEAMWVPSALLPRYGARWEATDDAHVSLRHNLDGTPVGVDYELRPDGRIRSLSLERWGDPESTGEFGLHRFGAIITRYRRFGGLTVPAAGRVGWNVGTDRWRKGEFFRFNVTALQGL
jgi:hypothetical protein